MLCGAWLPCLENLRYTTGAQDEIIVVDDGSIGPSAGIRPARSPPPIRSAFASIRNETPRGLAAAALQGLEAATRPRAVVMAPSLRVVGDWLARLAAHFDAQPNLGALVPTLMPVEALPSHQLFYPLELGAAGTGRDARRRASRIRAPPRRATSRSSNFRRPCWRTRRASGCWKSAAASRTC